jgi:cyanophycinase
MVRPGSGWAFWGGGRGVFALALATLFLFATGCASSAPSYSWRPAPVGVAPASPPQVGPVQGAVLVAGGGELGPEIWERFVAMAGGPDASIVVIPTAAAQDTFPENWSGLDGLRRAGASNLTILHTRDRDEANSEEFVEALRKATGVWIPGGRQWRLTSAYLHTRVHEELFRVLRRGGVVGGTSAGASVQASFLVRGDPDTNEVVISPGHEEGFGLLTNSAVDQHLRARGREDDLWQVLDLHPHLLGVGLDEGTAMVVMRDRAEVLGQGAALIYDTSFPIRRARILRPGTVFDLGRRMVIPVRVDDEDRDAAAGATHPL